MTKKIQAKCLLVQKSEAYDTVVLKDQTFEGSFGLPSGEGDNYKPGKTYNVEITEAAIIEHPQPKIELVK